MNAVEPIKLAFMIMVGFMLIVVGLSGKLGSLLGAIIDPGNMQEGAATSTTTNSTTAPVSPQTGTANVTLTPLQIKAYAAAAGFTGNGLITIIAIALAESGGQTHGKDNVNADGSRDRGLYQINSRWHPEVSDAQAYNAALASKEAFRISQSGTNFNPWTTYSTGIYKNYLKQAQQAGVVNVVAH